MEDNEHLETKTSSSGGQATLAKTMTLQQAIELGEYDPKYLANFPDWHTLSRHAQFQLIRQALHNRTLQLRMQWAEVCNQMNFSKKPYLQNALDNIQAQIKHLEDEEGRLYWEYSKG